MPRRNPPSGYSVECGNNLCPEFGERRALDDKPINRIRCTCGTEMLCFSIWPRQPREEIRHPKAA